MSDKLQLVDIDEHFKYRRHANAYRTDGGKTVPKDPTKNIARYKIEGGHLNEFEFHKNQEQLAEHRNEPSTNLIPGTPPEVRAERVEEIQAEARLTASKIAKKTKPAKKATPAKKAKPAKKRAAATKSKSRLVKTTRAAGKKKPAKSATKKPTRKTTTKKANKK